MVSEAARVTDAMFAAATDALTDSATPEDLAAGRLYPVIRTLRRTCENIATAVATAAWDEGIARRPRPNDVGAVVRQSRFEPRYPRYDSADV